MTLAVKVGFIGAGNMGGAIIKGLSEQKPGVYDIFAYDINNTITDRLSRQYPISVTGSASDLVKECEVVIAAVKPQYMEGVLRECSGSLTSSTIFVTVAAGLPISFYIKILGENRKIVRTMPNTPALVGEGMTVVSFGSHVNEQERKSVKEIFSCVGMVEEMDESLMSEVIALTGSSPAYVYILMEAMADAAVQSGIPRSLSYRMAAQAVMGSARMVLETGKHPAELKDMVCSPAGTTIEAVAALERKGFRDAIITAMGECTKRAREIGRETGK